MGAGSGCSETFILKFSFCSPRSHLLQLAECVEYAKFILFLLARSQSRGPPKSSSCRTLSVEISFSWKSTQKFFSSSQISIEFDNCLHGIDERPTCGLSGCQALGRNARGMRPHRQHHAHSVVGITSTPINPVPGWKAIGLVLYATINDFRSIKGRQTQADISNSLGGSLVVYEWPHDPYATRSLHNLTLALIGRSSVSTLGHGDG